MRSEAQASARQFQNKASSHFSRQQEANEPAIHRGSVNLNEREDTINSKMSFNLQPTAVQNDGPAADEVVNDGQYLDSIKHLVGAHRAQHGAQQKGKKSVLAAQSAPMETKAGQPPRKSQKSLESAYNQSNLYKDQQSRINESLNETSKLSSPLIMQQRLGQHHSSAKREKESEGHFAEIGEQALAGKKFGKQVRKDGLHPVTTRAKPNVLSLKQERLNNA